MPSPSQGNGRSSPIQRRWGSSFCQATVAEHGPTNTKYCLFESRRRPGRPTLRPLATGGCSVLRKLALSLALVSCAVMPLWDVAEASIVDGPFAPATEIKHIAPVEEALFIHRGVTYCWYPSGWRGPGFYRCGWAWRSGLGWGGGWGWNGWGGGWNSGWNGRGWHRGMRPPHRRPGARPGNNRPGNNRPGNNRPGNNRPGNNRPGNNRPGNNRPGHNRPGAGGGQRNRGGGNRRRSDIPSIQPKVATATFDYASIGAPAYAIVVRF